MWKGMEYKKATKKCATHRSDRHEHHILSALVACSSVSVLCPLSLSLSLSPFFLSSPFLPPFLCTFSFSLSVVCASHISTNIVIIIFIRQLHLLPHIFLLSLSHHHHPHLRVGLWIFSLTLLILIIFISTKPSSFSVIILHSSPSKFVSSSPSSSSFSFFLFLFHPTMLFDFR